MSDLGIGRTDPDPDDPRDTLPRSAVLVAEAVCIAHEELTEFARRVRFVAHDSAAVRRLCDEILPRYPGTGTSPSGD